MCRHCEHYAGERDGFVFCKAHAEDDEGSSDLLSEMYR